MASNKKAKGASKAPLSPSPAVPPEPTRGSGKFYYKNGATYDGEWILEASAEATNAASPSAEQPKGNRLKDGKGVYSDGEYSYDGEWTRDLANGQGIFEFASGAVYEGQWKMGSYSGIGTYKWPDGRCYTGEWRENKMHGKGEYTDKDGRKWVGQFFSGSGPGLTPEL